MRIIYITVYTITFLVILFNTYKIGYDNGKVDAQIEVMDKWNKIDLSTPKGMEQLKKDWLS